MLTPQQRSMRARIGGYARAAKYDGREMTRNARRAWEDRFEVQVDPDGILPLPERRRRAEAAKREYMTRLAYKSAVARQKKAS